MISPVQPEPSHRKSVLVAMDFPCASDALRLAKALDPKACRLKVGKELFTLAGPSLVEDMQKLGFDVFLDLKFHDIPNTVAAACRAACQLGVWMMNVHASGGRKMLEAAADAVLASQNRPLLVAVTVLTSLGKADLDEIGVLAEPVDQVLRLAKLSQDCGLDGVVCSAQEALILRTQLSSSFALVTPGIRPAGSATNDQQRITTPTEAIEKGASYLVIGRPITQASDPLAALAQINQEVAVAESAYPAAD